MADTTNPLTLEEHRDLAREITMIQGRLRELCNLVVAVYGPVNRASFSFQKTTEAVDHLCQDLQTQASRDLPGFAVDNLYPPL